MDSGKKITTDDLYEHCKRVCEKYEKLSTHIGTLYYGGELDDRVYQEHKMVMALIEAQSQSEMNTARPIIVTVTGEEKREIERSLGTNGSRVTTENKSGQKHCGNCGQIKNKVGFCTEKYFCVRSGYPDSSVDCWIPIDRGNEIVKYALERLHDSVPSDMKKEDIEVLEAKMEELGMNFKKHEG